MDLQVVAFDADDTLWHNERVFQLTQERFVELLKDHAEANDLAARLLEAERRNLGHYGYGVKGFVLSMIECALDVTNNRVPGSVIAQLLDAGQEMLAHPIELLPQAAKAVERAAQTHKIWLITKGDLLDQERKLAQSGLGDMFDAVEIVSEKNVPTYQSLFSRHNVSAGQVLMAGNSMRSDVLPVIEAGGWGIFVPHGLEWAHERAEPPTGHPRFREIADLGDLPAIIAEIEGRAA